MNILSVSCEVFPFSKTGGLADIVGSLPKEWEELGHNALVITPLHACIDKERFELSKLPGSVSVRMGFWEEYADLWLGTLPHSNVKVVFVENVDYFRRDSIYGRPEGFEDNDRRFLFFSRSVFSVCEYLQYAPDVLVANDYHTSFSLVHLKRSYREHPLFHKTLGVFSIHNLAFQGLYSFSPTYELAGLEPTDKHPYSPFEFYGNVNYMKAGIEFGDLVVTVSPTYASEIKTPQFGNGLEGVLQQQEHKLFGILNGVDYNQWNPEFDPFLHHHYSSTDLSGKRKTKYSFADEVGLESPDAPLLGLVSRLTDQKGIDIMQETLHDVLKSTHVNIAVQGSGYPEFERYFLNLEKQWPGRVYVHIGYNDRLAHLIEAAADLYLMPSRFEPCGLNQMYSLKYGTIPIVHPTGGLRDTIEDIADDGSSGYGVVMQELSSHELHRCILRGLRLREDTILWDSIVRRAMQCDYSSAKSALAYESLFKRTLATVSSHHS